MHRRLLIPVAALAITSLACTINLDLPNVPRLETGPTETFTVSEPLPSGDDVVDVVISMGAGKLDVTGGAEGLLEGEVQYNIADWKPEVTNSGDRVEIRQDLSENNLGVPDSNTDVVNDWNLKLGDAPMRLEINAGAYQGTVDLSGVPLRSVVVRDGASDAEVTFSELNPEEMDELSYQTGASSVTLTGLAYANAERIEFTGGAGDYELDFSGELQRDTQVSINSGVSSVKVVVPAGVPVKVTMDGALSNVDTEGTWTQSGSTYTAEGEGPALTIEVDMGVGELTLVRK